MRVLIACEESGVVRRAFRELGHDAWSCDLLASEDNSPFHIQADVIPLLAEKWDMLIAFPPCTDLAVSGARWFPEKIADGRQQRSIEFFMVFANAPIERIAIENPVGIMSRLWRKPNQIIQPYWFGHGETKATCLWLKNLPLLRPTCMVEGREQRIWKMPPSAERAKLRSKTYEGIGKAMALFWGMNELPPAQVALF